MLTATGTPVDTTSARQLPLAGEGIVWHVGAGTLDLFAARGGRGRWHFLGRVSAGAIVPPSAADAEYELVGRPGPDCVLHRLDVAALAGAVDAAGGIDAALSVLAAAVRTQSDGEPVPVDVGDRVIVPSDRQVAPEGELVWVEIVRGGTVFWGQPVRPGEILPLAPGDALETVTDTALIVRSTAELIGDGTLWQRLVRYKAGYWFALDRRIAAEEREEEQRLVAGRNAGDAALTQAVRTLRAQVDQGDTPAVVDEPFLTAIRVVAAATGARITPAADGADRSDEGIARIAEASGLRSRTVQLAPDWWRDDAGPLLARRSDSGALVALLWRRGGYDIVDPSQAHRIRADERIAHLVGPVAIQLYPPLPEKATSPWQLLRYGLRGAGADGARLLGAGVVSVALGLMVPVVTGRVLGQYVPAGERGLIVQACLAVIVASGAAVAFGVVLNLALLRAEGRFEAILQAGVWDRLLRQPTSFFTRYSTGELAGRALSISAVRETLSGVASVAVYTFLLGTVNFVLQLFYSVPLAALSSVLVLVNVSVFAGIGARQVYWQAKLVDLENKLTNKAFQTLKGLPKLRVAAAESYAYANWAADFTRSQDLQRRVRRLQGAVTVFNAAYVPFATLVLFAVLAGPAAGQLSVSGLLTFLVAFSVQLAAASQFTNAITSAGSVVPLLAQLRPVLKQPPEVAAGSLAPGELTGEIELRGVSFRYGSDGPLVLDDVSLRVRAGEFVAVVGPTGCGKSTLLRLLIGFEQPVSGTVMYDRQDLSTLDVGAVRRQCGVVLQGSQPFSGSILENICGAERYPTTQVMEAAALAGLAADIEDMPMGVHTVLTDNGSTLSGGQRQRLMIAQALIRKPKILFFDEATSALDNETQRIVTESTRTLRATRIVIAHRLSTIMDADRVIVLTDGKVVQIGPPARLLEDTAGLFHQLVRRQV